MRHACWIALLALALVAPAEADDRASVQEKLRAQLGQKRVRLDVGGLPFGPFGLSAAQETKAGNFTGRVRFGGQDAQALVHFVPKKRGASQGDWLLAIQPPATNLGALFPLVSGSSADAFQLSRPTLVFSIKRLSAERALLGSDAAAFYGSFARVSLELQKGVTLLVTASPRAKTPIAKALDLLGVESPQLNLSGVVLRDFDLSALKEAREKGRLEQALKEGTELRAALPALRVRGLPSAFKTSSAYLAVTGEPGVGIGFGLTLSSSDGTRRSFDCQVRVRKVAPPLTGGKQAGKKGATKTPAPSEASKVTEITVVAGTTGKWENALGVKGLDLEEVRLLLSFDQAQQVGFGLRAAMKIGENRLLLAGKVKFHAATGVITGGLFEGSLDSLTSRDLISLANSIARRKGYRGKQLSAASIPEFGLKDVYVRYAPEGDHDLGIASGMALEGKLVAGGRTLLDVAGLVDQSGLVPTIRIQGEVADLAFGPLSLKDASIDINLALTTEPWFRFKGASKLLIKSKRIEVDVSRKRFYFELEDKVGGVYTANWKVSSPAKGKPTWSAAVSLRNDFSKTLEREVSASAARWAKKVERDFAAAQKKVRAARDKVADKDRGIELAKAKVRARRARNKQKLADAQTKVSQLDVKIAARQEVVDKRRAPLRKIAKSLKKKRDKAKKDYEAVKKARKKAKKLSPKRAGLRVKEGKKLSALGVAQAAYKTAAGKLTKALTKLDVKLGSLKTARKTALVALKAAAKVYEHTLAAGPVELDPVVASLITARGTAIAALVLAEEAVKLTGKVVSGAGRVTAWAAKHHGKVLVLDSAAFKAELGRFLKGSKASLTLKLRFLGDRKTITLKVSAGQLAEGGAFKLLWGKLKSSLKKAKKK